MKRLLCIISCMNTGGAETFLMKLYRQLDKAKYQMDFCINSTEKDFYEDEIICMGGRIFRIPYKSQNYHAFKKGLSHIIRYNHYEYVLRVTSNAAGFLDLKIAKHAGAKVCAARSSNSSDGGGMKALIAHSLGRLLYGRYVDVKIAPSDLAGMYTFGKKSNKKGEVSILHNAVDLDVFQFDETGRREVREAFGISDNVKIVGHIGRFMTQKNHTFLINTFQCIHENDKNTVLMLVGDGDLQSEIINMVNERNLTDSVIFTGIRSDIPQLLSAMDVFVFPSLYEGMPNTVIEAQATGLPCIISDTITKEADITGLVDYISLRKPYSVWAELAMRKLLTQRRDTHDLFIDSHYNIQSATTDFVNLIFK